MLTRVASRVFACLLSLQVGGCSSSLAVQVDVLDPAVVEVSVSRRLIKESLPTALAQARNPALVDEWFTDLRNQHFGWYIEISESFEDGQETLDAARRAEVQALADQAGKLQDAFPDIADPRYGADKARVKRLNAEILTLHDRAVASRLELESCLLLVRKLREREAVLSAIVDWARADVQARGDAEILRASSYAQRFPRLLDAVRGFNARKAERIEHIQRELIGDQGLVESPHAFVIANAGDEKWATQFGYTVGRTVGGSSNIAIKMERLGTFTVKGVTFDPSDTARAARKVTVEAAVTAARVYGVPVPSAAKDTRGDAPTVEQLEEINTLRLRVFADEEALLGHRKALLAVGRFMAREADHIKSENKRDSAIDSIIATYLAHRPGVFLGNPPAVPGFSIDKDGAAPAGEASEAKTEVPKQAALPPPVVVSK